MKGYHASCERPGRPKAGRASAAARALRYRAAARIAPRVTAVHLGAGDPCWYNPSGMRQRAGYVREPPESAR
jgi:hypothetical protein